MKNINLGHINLIVSAMLMESYLKKENDNLLFETKKSMSEFFDVVKNSPILQLEFKVFENIENKYIENEALAIRYIDDNIKLFEIYTLDEITYEHSKLKKFLNESLNIDENKASLYDSIWILIEESLKIGEDVNVDRIHESFNNVLTHIKTKKKKPENKNFENINEDIIEIAIDKFNQKYESLTKDEVGLFKKLVNSDDNEKKDIFENYKNENLILLNSLNEESGNDKIEKSIKKINEMKLNLETIDKDIISLFELKKGLS